MKPFLSYFIFILSSVILIPVTLTLTTGGIASLPAGDETDDKIEIILKDGSEKIKMNFEDYITCVMYAKHSPTLPAEVLKSLAVIERTDAILNRAKHDQISVCNDPAHCSPFLTEADAKKQWDISYAGDYIKNIKNAVTETRGVYLSYNNKVITAFYHTISANGITENGNDFFGLDLPYLKSVDAKDKDVSLKSQRYKTVSKTDFQNQIRSISEDINLNLSPFIGFMKRTAAGNLLEITICDRKFGASQIAKLFDLGSTAFTIAEDEDNIVFQINGAGNSLGLSIEGAKSLAQGGMGYQDILSYYYTGTVLKTK